MADIGTLYSDIRSLILQFAQEKLVSGSNLKTINNQSLLGSGNISVGGGGLSIDDVYPIGSIYMSVNSTSPQTLFGGTWEQIKDKFLLSCGDTYNNGATGGSADAIVVSHTHTFDRAYALTTDSTQGIDRNSNAGQTGTKVNNLLQSNGGAIYRNTINSTGDSGTGKNMPPYLTVYMWKRTA